jgi:hypothetical protein
MRVPNPQLVRLGGSTRGAIVEPGDGELEVPPVVQPIIELSSPVDKVVTLAPSTAVQDSFFTAQVVNRIGVQAALTTVITTLSRGAWAFDLGAHAGFIGTSNLALGTFDELQLVDPDGAAQPIFHFPRLTGQFMSWAHTLRVVFQRDGWNLNVTTGATVAADNLCVAVSVNARKSA